MKIGFIGLGNMGAAIAANLVRAGHDVTVWNRSADKARDLIEAGALLASNPKGAAANRDVVFTMLADDAALNSVLAGEHGLVAGLSAGKLHISLSTIGVANAGQMAATHKDHAQHLLCAPVFGRPQAAADAKLSIVVAGESSQFDLARPLLDAIGQRVFYLGADQQAAALVKLCGNFMILSAIEALAEAMALAEKGGVAKKQLLEILTSTLFDSPVYRNYGAMLIENRFKPAGFAAPLGLKDMRLVGQSAEALRVPMPILNVLRDHLLQTISQQGEDIDWSGIAVTIAHNAGLATK